MSTVSEARLSGVFCTVEAQFTAKNIFAAILQYHFTFVIVWIVSYCHPLIVTKGEAGVLILKKKTYLNGLIILNILILFACVPPNISALAAGAGEAAIYDTDNTAMLYQEYMERLESVEKRAQIGEAGFRIIKDQVFPMTLQSYGKVAFIPALDEKYNRLAIFFADVEGRIVYKTDQLETNNRVSGELRQPNQGIAAVSFQDLNGDGMTDIVLITSCVNEVGDYAGKAYKAGDVLFQNEQGFYRDWRLSDKINRFSMNKSVEFITSFVRDGNSTEILYTAATLNELLEKGVRIISEQCYFRDFEKLGRLQVVPASLRIADCEIFIIYLVNEQGYIVWSLQPMEDYDNLYALKGITCRDIDGDGMKDMVVLARYSYDGDNGAAIVKTDYSVYYQRTGGFYADTDIKDWYQCADDQKMEDLVGIARSYWGWGGEEEE